MATGADTKSRTACYVYGVVPGDVEVQPEARGVGDPPSPITLVRQGDLAAMVSEVDPRRPIGEPDDFTAHAAILDSTAAEVPVIPMRFGAVVSNQDAVADELLAANHDEFVNALRQLEGHAQYVVKGRYDEKAILAEVLSENEDAATLRDAVHGKPDETARNDRMALGELVNNAIVAKRQLDTRQTIEALDKLGLTVNPREPTHEFDAVHVACLAEVAKEDELEKAVGKLAEAWQGRVSVRLLGPLAPYDFVTTTQEQHG